MEISNLLFTMWTWVMGFVSEKMSFRGFRLLAKSTVGIFSREDESCYTFLRNALRSQDLLVREVRPFVITNNRQQAFREEVTRCCYAILYHSKKRGRLNITDVTDSLYDEELTYLSEKLGRDHVIVVADDLDSSSFEKKQKILSTQPLIADMAKDLFLFSAQEKISSDNTMWKKIHQMIQHIDSTAPTLYVCEESQGLQLQKSLSFLNSTMNIFMSKFYKILQGFGQTRIKHFDVPERR